MRQENIGWILLKAIGLAVIFAGYAMTTYTFIVAYSLGGGVMVNINQYGEALPELIGVILTFPLCCFVAWKILKGDLWTS